MSGFIFEIAQRKSDSRFNIVFRAFVFMVITFEKADSQRYVDEKAVSNDNGFAATFGYVFIIIAQTLSKVLSSNEALTAESWINSKNCSCVFSSSS